MSQHEDDGYDVPIAVVAGGHDDGMTLSWSPFSSNDTPQQQQQQPRQLTPLPTFPTTSSSIPMVAPQPPSLGAASRIPAVHRTIPSSSSSSRRRAASTVNASRNHRHSSNNNNNSNNPNSHMAAAVFYGECSKEGIPPTAAERAAMDVHGQYRRWWVDAVASGTTAEDATTSSSRRRRRSSTSTSTSVGRKRPREQQHSHHHQNEEDRNVIHRVSQRQQEQGGGYVFPSAVMDPVSTNTTTGSTNTGNSRRLLASSVVIDGKKVPISLPSSAAAAEAFVSQNYKTNDEELRKQAQTRIRTTKAQLLAILKENGGNASTDDAKAKLQILHDYYLTTERDARSTHSNSNNNKSHALHNNDNNNNNNNNNIDANDILAGNWLALSQPAYNGCLGTNVHHHYQYTLGRMSFDMYRPTTLVCSIQANFSSIHGIDDPAGIPSYVPRRLRAEVQKCRNRATHARYNKNHSSSMSMNSSQHSHVSSSNNSVESHSRSGSMSAGSTLRSYTISVALTIEADQSQTTTSKDTNTTSTHHSDNHDKQPPVISRPIRGIMKNNGYMLPDPKVPNRLSIWFTEGTLEVNDLESDLEEWKRIFSAQKPKLGLYDRASILAARLLLGANMPDTMDDDGTMSYSLTRPIGGHGFAYVDVLYVDDDLRVLRGHGGQVYVCARLAETVAGADDDDDDDSVDAG